MTPTLWFRFLFGNAAAIRAVAASRAAFPTGIALVLLTAIPRNYDQTFLLEAPAKWLFGNLGFSVVSGTWLYLVAYACTARVRSRREDGTRPGFWSGWPAFMGLFWFTAPIAWLYAIPVERYLGEYEAARANITMLGIVSCWRVVLMIRVISVVSRAPLWAAMFWVLAAVFVETFFVTLFGGLFAQSVAAGMAGMRYSPAETLVQRMVGTAMAISFYGLPFVLIAGIAAVKAIKPNLPELPRRVSGRPPWRWLAAFGILWTLIAIPAQRQVLNNARVDRMTRDGQYRAAVEYMATRTQSDFAPSRPLPPKIYEFTAFKELPAFLALVETDHPAWLRRHFVDRAIEFTVHFEPWSKQAKDDLAEWANQIGRRDRHIGFPEHLAMMDKLAELPEGREWLRSDPLYLRALEAYADQEAPLTATNGINPVRQLREKLKAAP